MSKLRFVFVALAVVGLVAFGGCKKEKDDPHAGHEHHEGDGHEH